VGSDKRTLSPLVDADPDLAEKEAPRNSSIVQQNELDVQARYGISVAKSNGRFNATVATSVGFNQTASAFGDSYDSPLGRSSSPSGSTCRWSSGAGRAFYART